MYVLFNLFVVIISQGMHTSDHPIVHLKYIQFLFVSHTLIKLENKNKNGSLCALKQVPPYLRNHQAYSYHQEIKLDISYKNKTKTNTLLYIP